MPALTDTITNPRLREIADKVDHHIPVDRDDAAVLMATPDILDLGTIARHIRFNRHGRTTYYGVNLNLNYTNICRLRCPLCAYSRDAGDPGAYLLSLDEIERRVEEAVAAGIDEIHIVGGLHPDLPLEYFEEMIRRARRVSADLYLVAFTATEYDYLAKLSGLPLSEVFDRFIAAGVNALPGGGAEIFAPEVRRQIAPRKISGQRWLEVMRIAHQAGLKTNATMLYNHLESAADIVDHLLALRQLQDETGGFKTFVPLRFHGANTRVKEKTHGTGFDEVRLYAASRIVLHNIPHLKGLWMYLGEKMAQVMLHFGVDDIGATYNDEKVVHAAGATTADHGSEPFLRRLIENAGLTPRRATAGYL